MIRPNKTPLSKRGFALVISIALMVLLLILTVGMLSLSTISLRSSSHAEAMAAAKANARMALSLAIGELQKWSGPDKRITTAADQLAAGGGKGDETAAAPGRRHWTGVYKSWDAAAEKRPSPEFLAWLVSSPEPQTRALDDAKNASSSGEMVRLVGEGTMGKQDQDFVDAPLVSGTLEAGLRGRFAWWVGDQGVKAALAAPPRAVAETPALARQDLQGTPRNAVELAEAEDDARPFKDLTANSPDLPKVTDWRQSEHLAKLPEEVRPLFHDLAASSAGLLTNVRAGGFRKDLSMYLERDAKKMPVEALYRISNQEGIRMSELWLHYNMWKELKSGKVTFTTGGSSGNSTPYLQLEDNQTKTLEDQEYYYKQPAFIAYHTVVSMSIRANNRLALVIDPIVVYWNPLDVPVMVSPAYNSIKFWQLPYDLSLNIGTKTVTTSMRSLLAAGAHQYLTLIAGKAQPLALRPGEVLMVSQGPTSQVQAFNAGLNYLDGRAGWNLGGGVAIDMKDTAGNYIMVNPGDTVRYDIRPNGQICDGTRRWSINQHETYYKEDRKGRGESIGIGGIFVDYIYGQPHTEASPKPESARRRATDYPVVFDKIKSSDTRPLSGSQLSGRKEPIMMYSYVAKTENGTDRGAGRYLQHFNPKAMCLDFYDLSDDERDVLPFEVQIQPMNSWKNRNLEVSPNGNGYFGGGMNAEFGTNRISTHSVPREPLYSLAAFQHAFANGFSSNNPIDGYAIIKARSGMLPQVSHPIGNSNASGMIPKDRTDRSLQGGPRVLADHAYLANRALWDDWFLSGIAPQTASGFTKKRAQKQVAEEFLKGEGSLPVSRYLPNSRTKEERESFTAMLTGSGPSDAATALAASLIRVDGMFNVNSTSVEAWKSLLGGLRNRPVIVRDANGAEKLVAGGPSTPVVGLFAPESQVVDGNAAASVTDIDQWVGRRTLSDAEIEALAKALVREVRKRGPFLSLADFVNRRVGTDESLAKAGAIQAALDADDVPINQAWRESDRAVQAAVSSRLAFPAAEKGPAASGIPGIVKQADILTPIAPVISVRSDSFIIRSYGETVSEDGKVQARAWCEATVERDKSFIDPKDKPETLTDRLQAVNRSFGRRYRVTSFRWLNPEEV